MSPAAVEALRSDTLPFENSVARYSNPLIAASRLATRHGGFEAAAEAEMEAAELARAGRDVEIVSERAVASLLTTFWWPVCI